MSTSEIGWRREYNQRNKEKLRVQKQTYYQAHKEERTAYERNRYQTDEEYRKSQLARKKKRTQKLKLEVFSHYSSGTPICALCGFKDLRALSIDHTNGGGNRHRIVIGGGGGCLWRWLKREQYPEGYRVLCMNCQFISGKK